MSANTSTLEKPHPNLPFRQQPLAYRRAYNREARRKNRISKVPLAKVKDLPRDELLARRRQQRQQQRAAAKERKDSTAKEEGLEPVPEPMPMDKGHEPVSDGESDSIEPDSAGERDSIEPDSTGKRDSIEPEQAGKREREDETTFFLDQVKRNKLSKAKASAQSDLLEPIDPGTCGTDVIFKDKAGNPILQIFTVSGKRRRERRLKELEAEGSLIFDELWQAFTIAKAKADKKGKVKKGEENEGNANEGKAMKGKATKGKATKGKATKGKATKGKATKGKGSQKAKEAGAVRKATDIEQEEDEEKAQRLDLNPAFGLWHGQGRTTFGFSAMSTMDRDLTLDLLGWGRRYTRAALQRQKMHPTFQKRLIARRKIRPQLRKQFGDDANLLHTFWSTLFLFKDATSNAHTDTHDDNPSLLFNFGGHAWLALPEFGVKVRLHPLDAAIFASSQYKHYTLVDEHEQKRWAIGCFMRTSVLKLQPRSTFSMQQKVKASLKQKTKASLKQKTKASLKQKTKASLKRTTKKSLRSRK